MKKKPTAKKRQKTSPTKPPPIQLTDKLREEIKDNPRSFKKSELSPEALTYRNRVIGAAKARKIKKERYIFVGDLKVDKRTESYELLEALAQSEDKTVKDFIKDSKDTKEFLQTYVRYDPRYFAKILKMLDELRKGAKIYNNGEETTIHELKKNLETFVQTAVSYQYYPDVSSEVGLDLFGNLYFHIPTQDETNQIVDEGDFLYFLDSKYPDIIVYKDTRPAAKKAAAKALRERKKNR